MSISWTVERRAQLTLCLEGGMTAQQAAETIGVGNKNAIIGAAHRYGIKFKRPSGGGAGRPKRPRRERTIAIRPRFIRGVSLPGLEIPLAEVEPVTELPFLCVELTALAANDCRYPHGASNYKFCGQPKRAGLSYCEFHAHICHPQLKAA